MAQDPYLEFPNYDLEVVQGSDYKYHFVWKDGDKVPYNLAGATAEMQIRRSFLSEKLIFWVRGSNATGGGYTKEFYATGGVSGSASILLNVNANGVTGTTGGILIQIGNQMTKNFPVNFHFYDMEVTFPDGTKDKPIRGRVSVPYEITK